MMFLLFLGGLWVALSMTIAAAYAADYLRYPPPLRIFPVWVVLPALFLFSPVAPIMVCYAFLSDDGVL